MFPLERGQTVRPGQWCANRYCTYPKANIISLRNTVFMIRYLTEPCQYGMPSSSHSGVGRSQDWFPPTFLSGISPAELAYQLKRVLTRYCIRIFNSVAVPLRGTVAGRPRGVKSGRGPIRSKRLPGRRRHVLTICRVTGRRPTILNKSGRSKVGRIA